MVNSSNHSKYKLIIVLIAATNFIGTHCISCAEDQDCVLEDTSCQNQQCVCNKGFFFNADGTKCLPYVTEYHGKCSEDAQCEWLGENSECQKICKCKDGFRWFKGQCKAFVGLGETCADSTDCFDGYDLQSLSCNEGKCGCSPNFYLRDGLDCRREATTADSLCALDIDCRFDKGICLLGRCEIEDNLRTEWYSETGQYSSLHKEIKEAIVCKEDSDCEKNFECYDKTGTCICKRGYFSNGEECIAELAMDVQCKEDDDCKLRPGKCVDGVCYCRDYYFTEDGNRKCIKTMGQNNWNCLSGEWCYALGKYSYCNSDGACNCSKVAELDTTSTLCKLKDPDDPELCSTDIECQTRIEDGVCIDEQCTCAENQRFVDGRCLPNIGAPCDTDKPCTIENSICRNGICRCEENFVSFENTVCYPVTENLTGSCLEDVQCKVKNSVCVDQMCTCLEKYIPHENFCYQRKSPNEYCSNLLECTLSLGESFVCRKNICQCPTFYQLQDGSRCGSSGVANIANLILGGFLWILIALMFD